MTIRYKCPECGAALNIKDELAGTQGHCPRCQVEFTVPAPEGDALVEKEAAKKPAVAAAEPPAAKKRASSEPLSEDDIEALLEGGGPESSSAGYGVAGEDDGDDTDHEGDDSPDFGDDEADDDETEDEEDAEEDDLAARQAKEEGKVRGEGAALQDRFIGIGGHRKEPDGSRRTRRGPRRKKGSRPFGGTRDGRDEDRDGHSAKEVAGYFVKQAWPIVLGGVAFMGLCYWLSSLLFKGVELPPLAPVTGTVTLDGKPLEKAIIQFQPRTESAHPNLRLGTSFGFTGPDGKYTLTYLVDVPGAVLGKHYVVIKAEDEKGADRLPAHYSHNSILEADVVKDGPPIDFALSSSPEPPAK